MVWWDRNSPIVSTPLGKVSGQCRSSHLILIPSLSDWVELTIILTISNRTRSNARSPTRQHAQTALSLLRVWNLCRFWHSNQLGLFLEDLCKWNNFYQPSRGKHKGAVVFSSWGNRSTRRELHDGQKEVPSPSKANDRGGNYGTWQWRGRSMAGVQVQTMLDCLMSATLQGQHV